MVIQRRFDGSVDFNRDWEQYQNGFGFLSSEFWLGNEKLSYLTNQGKYELRIEIELSNGSSLFASYDSFRLSDGWSQYKLASVGNVRGNIVSAELSCPSNMMFGNCTCQPSCDDPSGLERCEHSCNGTESCICSSGFVIKDDECVPISDCGCFLNETNSVLSPGETHINVDCSEKCTCENGATSCNSNYICDPNASCREGGCYCNEGYDGDGETCTALYTDCYDALTRLRPTQDGIYTIMPREWTGSPFNVYCDMTTDGGGWTIFQRRIDRVTNFYRNWTEYQQGFGSVQHGSDFWLGNEQLHYLTNQKSYKLRVDIVDSGDDGFQYANGASFSTHDEDHDGCSYHDCAEGHTGGWWYKPPSNWCVECYYSYRYCDNFDTRSRCTNCCTPSNLNGDYNGGYGQNIFWYLSTYCNLNSAEMKIRPNSADA